MFEFVFQRRQLADRVPEVLGGLSGVVLRCLCHPPPFLDVRDGFGVMLDDVLPDGRTEAAKRDHEGLFRWNVQLLSHLLDGGEEVVCGL